VLPCSGSCVDYNHMYAGSHTLMGGRDVL
jgi:hypothetical protein